MSTRENKAALRARALEKLSSLSREYLDKSGAAVCAALMELPEYKNANTVFCYASMGREIPTRSLIASVLSEGRNAALPQTMPGGVMIFRYIRDMDSLRPGRYGIMEPDSSCPRAFPSEGGVCIVPGLCFDEEGRRLGRGGGYYDRWLGANPVLKIGLGREELLYPVPTDETDSRMDMVLTESRLIRP